MLLLGNGHCFRDQVLEVCPEMARFSTPGNGMQRTFEGSSLETIRHMVASGIGLTVLPRTSVADMKDKNGMLSFVPFSAPVPSRRVVHRLAQELHPARRDRGDLRRGGAMRFARRRHARAGSPPPPDLRVALAWPAVVLAQAGPI